MFFESPVESKLAKTEKAIKEITIQMDALQKEFNEFRDVINSHSEIAESALYAEELDINATTRDLKLLEDLLLKHASNLQRAKKSTLAEAQKKQTDRQIPPHWLFVR